MVARQGRPPPAGVSAPAQPGRARLFGHSSARHAAPTRRLQSPDPGPWPTAPSIAAPGGRPVAAGAARLRRDHGQAPEPPVTSRRDALLLPLLAVTAAAVVLPVPRAAAASVPPSLSATVLVAGATGETGRRVVAALRARGYTVLAGVRVRILGGGGKGRAGASTHGGSGRPPGRETGGFPPPLPCPGPGEGGRPGPGGGRPRRAPGRPGPGRRDRDHPGPRRRRRGRRRVRSWPPWGPAGRRGVRGGGRGRHVGVGGSRARGGSAAVREWVVEGAVGGGVGCAGGRTTPATVALLAPTPRPPPPHAVHSPRQLCPAVLPAGQRRGRGPALEPGLRLPQPFWRRARPQAGGRAGAAGVRVGLGGRPPGRAEQRAGGQRRRACGGGGGHPVWPAGRPGARGRARHRGRRAGGGRRHCDGGGACGGAGGVAGRRAGPWGARSGQPGVWREEGCGGGGGGGHRRRSGRAGARHAWEHECGRGGRVFGASRAWEHECERGSEAGREAGRGPL